MKNANILSGDHNLGKTNLVTQTGRKSSFDLYQCSYCKLKGKRFGLSDNITLPDTVSDKNAFTCKNAPNVKQTQKVQIIKCNAYGARFDNLKPDSIHDVIEPPKPYKNDLTGLWVMGVGEPVKLLRGEYEEI